jgi:hypothetical protein
MTIKSGRLDGAEGWIVREQKLLAEVEKWKEAAIKADGSRVAAIARADGLEQKLWRELSEISSAIGTTRYMAPPDGGDVSLAEQVRRMKADYEKSIAACLTKIDALVSELKSTQEQAIKAIQAALPASETDK